MLNKSVDRVDNENQKELYWEFIYGIINWKNVEKWMQLCSIKSFYLSSLFFAILTFHKIN